jgi:cation:H+ antiporter
VDNFLSNTLIYVVSFLGIWFGAGLIVSSIDRLSRRLKISSFAFSFFVLGMLTSIPEFAIGMTALAEGKPGIFVGNLIGGILVIFILIIPILAILGNGIKLHHRFNAKRLLFSFAVMLTPSFLVMDGRIDKLEGIIIIILYAFLFYFIQREKGIFDMGNNSILDIRVYSFRDMAKVLVGIAVVFVSSKLIVDNTLYFADILNVSPYYISLILLSIGTNLPELSIAIRAIMMKKRDVAFGDYVGSGAANAFLFGIFTILSPTEILPTNHFLITFLITVLALGLVFYFLKSKNDISRKEGILLLLLYIFFVIIEGI